MSVYIEYIFIDNLVINCLILLCVKNTLKLKTKWWRILISSVLGTIVAILLPLFNLSNLALILIKICLGVSMVLILSNFLRFKDFVFAFILFVVYTLLLAGACVVTLLGFGTSLELLASGGYDISIPLGIIMAIVALYVSIIIYLAKYLSRKKELSGFLRKIKIQLCDKEIMFDAFIDSGNKLIDSKTGLPVLIISIKALERYFSSEEIEDLMLMKGEGLKIFKNVHNCYYGTISGEAKTMVVFEGDKLTIMDGEKHQQTDRFVVGVTYKKFKDAVNYDCLLNVAFVA